MEVNNKKKIILCSPNSFGIEREMYSHLLKLGFEVTLLSFNPSFKYTTTRRIKNFLLKTFLRKYDYKKSILFQENKDFLQKLSNIKEKADYALVLRCDLYPKYILETIKAKTNKLIAYQWDNFSVFPEGKRYVNLFDAFYTFDPYDVNVEKGRFFACNFYFEPEKATATPPAPLVYFLGSLYPNKLERVDLVASVLKITKKLNYLQKVFFLNANKIEGLDIYQKQGIEFFNSPISYQESLEQAKKATLLIDILGGKNKGLSFRIFESLNYSKKLITNNTEVKKYDFYDPCNIYVIENNNTDGIDEFLNAPYKEVPKEIKEKYSFKNWIHYILGIEPYKLIPALK